MSIFKDQSGQWSSKRAVGLSYAALGIVMCLLDLLTDKSMSFDILIVVVSTSLAALGISNFAPPKKTEIKKEE